MYIRMYVCVFMYVSMYVCVYVNNVIYSSITTLANRKECIIYCFDN